MNLLKADTMDQATNKLTRIKIMEKNIGKGRNDMSVIIFKGGQLA